MQVCIRDRKECSLMKSFVRWFLAWLVCWMMPLYAGAETAGPVIQDGAAQPFIAYTSAQDPEYTNEGSEILRFVVYVETDYDTDLDGRPDLIKTMVQLPRAAAEGAYAYGTFSIPVTAVVTADGYRVDASVRSQLRTLQNQFINKNKRIV